MAKVAFAATTLAMRRTAFWALLGFASLACANAEGADETGARIYHQGQGDSPIFALIAGGKVEVPGKLFPCVNCHKEDGLGVLEGGLKPRDITWPTLTNPTEAGGRGYDEVSLRHAIVDGVDSHGTPLSSAMPRYRMADTDLIAVITWLRSLDAGAPGVSGEAVRFKTVLPLQGRMADIARLVERFLDLAVLDINTRRRFEGRRIIRESVPFDPDVPGDALRAVKKATAADPPFAFLANYTPGSDGVVHDFLADAGIPNIAPISVPLTPDERGAIWIEPSVADQARVLVDASFRMQASSPDRPVRIGLFWSDDQESMTAADAARDEIRQLGGELLLDRSGIASLSGDIDLLRSGDANRVLFFGQAEALATLLSEAEVKAWHPAVFGRRQQLEAIERDPALQRRADIFLVTSYGGVEPRSRGAYDFRRVAGELGGGHPELLRDAYVGAKLVETTLASTGRRLTRPNFLATIAGTHDFETGVIAPLSFGADSSRRGTATVMRLDPSRGRLVPLEPGFGRVSPLSQAGGP